MTKTKLPLFDPPVSTRTRPPVLLQPNAKPCQNLEHFICRKVPVPQIDLHKMSTFEGHGRLVECIWMSKMSTSIFATKVTVRLPRPFEEQFFSVGKIRRSVISTQNEGFVFASDFPFRALDISRLHLVSSQAGSSDNQRRVISIRSAIGQGTGVHGNPSPVRKWEWTVKNHSKHFVLASCWTCVVKHRRSVFDRRVLRFKNSMLTGTTQWSTQVVFLQDWYGVKCAPVKIRSVHSADGQVSGNAMQRLLPLDIE